MMQKCVERGRYRIGGGNKAKIGIGRPDAKLTYLPMGAEMRFSDMSAILCAYAAFLAHHGELYRQCT